MIDRIKLFEELKLREHIRKVIQKEKTKIEEEKEQEFLLREYIRKIVTEASEEDEIPHTYTGINILAALLKKIIPVIEEDYKSLTTNKKQRDSFRAHLITATKNVLVPSRMKKQIGDPLGPQISNEEEALGEGDINVRMGDEADSTDYALSNSDNPDAFIDISKKTQKMKNFVSLPGQDMTGRNISMVTFEKVQRQISDAYSLLDDKEDENIFCEYLITNLKLYFDKFEDELSASVGEPSTASYEKEKGDQGEEVTMEPGGEEEDSVGIEGEEEKLTSP